VYVEVSVKRKIRTKLVVKVLVADELQNLECHLLLYTDSFPAMIAQAITTRTSIQNV